MTIVAEALTKVLGERPAVCELSLRVGPGEVYGLIGANGAGKTTTMRMLVGLMRPSSGRALICGHDIERDPSAAKRQLGFVSASTGLYARLTPLQLLFYFGQLYGLPRSLVRARALQLAEELDFLRLRQRWCGKLSTGERQRVSLARAALHEPAVLVLDEPTAGLDVLASRTVIDFIGRLRAAGRAVLLSTHYMTEAELLCDRIGLLYGGVLAAEGTPSEIKQRFGVGTLEQAFFRLQDLSLGNVGQLSAAPGAGSEAGSCGV